MKYGVNSLIWTANFDASNIPILPRIKEAGFDGVELTTFLPYEFPAAQVRRAVAENGLECTFCTVPGGDLNLTAADPEIRRRTIAHIADCVKICAEAGSKIMIGPFYAPIGYLPGRRRTAEEWKWAADGLRTLGETCARYGVTIAFEPLNRFETYFINTAADAVALADEVAHPNIGLMLDTFHGNIEEKDLGEAFRGAARHLKHVHACENDRGAPGSGHVEWTSVFQALRDIGYDDWMVIESFGYNIKEIATAACIWRDLAPTPEDIAFEGVKFLKKGMAAAASA